ncbi:MAG: Flp family type IVb pilin [Alphaproteobacteria bacterium]
MSQILGMFAERDEGATMIEYALICALIAVVVASSVGSLGVAVKGMYDTVNTIPF